MQSHYDNELWGLTINPKNQNQVCTGGGDNTLRIWDMETNKQLKHCILDKDFRAIDWSSDGSFIVAGSKFGKIYLISVDDMKIKDSFDSIFKNTNEKQWIQELKISPDSKMVAYGGHGSVSKVEVLNVENWKFKKYGEINPKFTSSLTHLDWSVDSESIVCNSLAFELKFLNVPSKKLIAASGAKAIEWNTWTCLFGFPVQGYFF